MAEAAASTPTVRPPDRRKLIAVVYADMVGYSRLIGLDDAGTLRRLRTLRRALIDPAIREHGGKVVQTGGDSLLVAFDSIDGAVQCAVRVQQQVPVYDGDRAPDRRIRFRVGINIGDVISEGTNLHGDGVNIAARLEAASPVGGICVSRSVRDHVHGRLDLAFESIGKLTLKNITRPVEAFVLRLDPTAMTGERSVPVVSSATAPDVGLSNAPPLSLVVLPFDNLGGSGVEDYIVDGITEDLTTDLSRVPDFLVIARNSALTYKGKPIDVKRVGQELGVRYAVEGSVRGTGSALRVTAQLVSTETGAHLWADRFDVGREGIGYDVDDIVRQIAIALNVRLVNVEAIRGIRERPGNPEVSDLLLQARSLYHQPVTPETQSQIVTLYERAVELDPSSAAGLAGLAEALLDTPFQADDPTAAFKIRRAEQLLTKAEQLRPDDEKVMWVRVYLLGAQRRHPEAMQAARRAIEDALRNHSGTHFRLAMCLLCEGKAADAIPALEQALRLNPRNPHNSNRFLFMGYALILLDRCDEAVPWLRKSLAANPNVSAPRRAEIYAAIAAVQALAGHIKEAHASAAEASRNWPPLTVRLFFKFSAANSTNPAVVAQVAHLRDGLRLAGLRDHADEDAENGIAPDNVLHIDYDAATPGTAPGVRTIRTPDLARLIDEHKPLVLDASLPWGMSIPGAVGLWGVGVGGSVFDNYQARLRTKIQQLTKGDPSAPVVTMAWNAERYQGRNLALRLVALGYTNVYWYRGGREAWEVAGLPEIEIEVQDW
jgi:TolB-like protein/class 3 adenylate cyclase/tetratricopeptide (TPR) repeat protein